MNANQPPPPHAWRDRSPLHLTPPLHVMPQNFNKALPKFEPNEGILMEHHLQSFYLDLEGLQAAEHEYVVCRLFPHTLKGKETSWYFSLQANSITNWNTFERLFKNKYGIQKTHTALMKGLISLKKENKERVHNFTQRFVSYMNNFNATDKPTEHALIEYYTLALGPDLAMFVKRSVRPTLVENMKKLRRWRMKWRVYTNILYN